jgi:hypothetical protein
MPGPSSASLTATYSGNFLGSKSKAVALAVKK